MIKSTMKRNREGVETILSNSTLLSSSPKDLSRSTWGLGCSLPSSPWLGFANFYPTTQVGRWFCKVDQDTGGNITANLWISLNTEIPWRLTLFFSWPSLPYANVNGILPSITTTTRKWLEASIYSLMFDISLVGLRLRALLVKTSKTSAKINCIARCCHCLHCNSQKLHSMFNCKCCSPW